MKNLKIKLLTLGVLATVVMSSTPAFAATKTSTSNASTATITKTETVAASSSTASVSKTPAIPGTIKPSFNYGPDGGPNAPAIIASGGVIQSGDVGLAVKQVQAQLNAQNYPYNQITVDGYFGGATYSAVVNFQGKHHLTQDGVVGSQTWYYLTL
jgi:peptidoglycan hydrolase-like protein with peptidoglycan-binding domain